MDKRKVFIVGGISVLTITGIVVLANRSRNKKLIAQLNNILDSGSQATGSAVDVRADVAFSPDFYKTLSGVGIYKTATADAIAKKIYDDIGQYGGAYDNETDIVSVLSKIPSKAHLSFVAERFMKAYGQSLGQFITYHVDKGDNLQQIRNVINSMPKSIK